MNEFFLENRYLTIVLTMVVLFIIIKYFEKIKSAVSSLNIKGDGNTPILNSYTIDFTALAASKKIDIVIGREHEILRLAQILSRRGKNNSILVGEPGVGKTAIAEGLAARIVSGDVPEVLKNKRVLSLNVASLLSGTKYRGEFEARAKKLVEEIERTNRSVILFIDEIHSIIQSSGTEGSVNFSDILKPALARGNLQVIGATTLREYNTYIKTDKSLERRFQPIEVKEPSAKDTIKMLQGLKETYEIYHKVTFTDAALEAAVKFTNKIKMRSLPDKAIDALDEAGAIVRVSHVHEAIPVLLYNAAVVAHPQIKKTWKKIQDLDAESLKKYKEQIKIKREKLEDDIAKKGVLVVDVDDVKRAINEWDHQI